MFSVMNTGTCRRPSWTPKFSPTISGMIIESRDQVRITVASPDSRTRLTFLSNLGWTYGPFLIDLDMVTVSACRAAGRHEG